MVVDVDAPGAAVAESVAGECADEALKAGCRSDCLAQRGAVDVQRSVLRHGNGFDGTEQQRRSVVREGPVRRGR